MHRWLMTAVGQPLTRAELSLDPPRPGEVTVAVAGCGVCHTEAIFSRIWLANFNYGPMEWLWRSATYLKWQPLRRAA